MARGQKAAPAGPTREELEVVVQEVNTILGLEGKDAIVIGKKDTDEDIIAAIKAVADGQLYESDFQPREGEGEEEGVTFFSEAADKTMELIGIEVLPGEPPANEEPAPAPANAGKGKAAPAPAKGKEEPAKEKAKKTPPTPPERYSRYQAFADAVLQVKKPISKADLDKLVSAQYAKKGGKENAAENAQVVTRSLQVCIGLGYADTDKNGNIVFKG